jgi:uncharacterized protein
MIPALSNSISNRPSPKEFKKIVMLATLFLIFYCQKPVSQIQFENPFSYAYHKMEQRISLKSLEDQLIIPESPLYDILELQDSYAHLRSTGKEGYVVIKTRKGIERVLKFWPIKTDLDEDGFPDVLELHDSRSQMLFRQRLLLIAELQLKSISPAWQDLQRDCAGLIRFSYIQALQKPTAEWLKSTGFKALKGRSALEYPWELYEKLQMWPFKISKGRYRDKNQFSNFADAEHLMKYHTVFMEKNIENALPGDLVFFFNPQKEEMPYHAMLVTKTAPELELIYHTGGNEGLKKVKISYLQHSPDFYPHKSNIYYMGVYRFKIIQ